MNRFVWKVKTDKGKMYSLIRKFALMVLRAGIPVKGPARTFFRAVYTLHVLFLELLAVIRKFFYAEPLFRTRCEKVGTNLRMERLPYIQGHGKIIVGNNVHLSGRSSFTVGGKHYPEPELVIGDDTFIGHNCSIAVNQKITIGNHCLLASGVKISDTDGHPVDFLKRMAKDPVAKEDIKPVIIEDDVWIGTEAIILKGVRIGARSIIGADSVVTRDIPPDVIAAGNPARVIRSLKEIGKE